MPFQKHTLVGLVALLLQFPATSFSAEATGKLPSGISVSVVLEKGIVDVNSTRGQMQHFRESTTQTQSDFEAFKRQGEEAVRAEKEAFDRYIEQTNREFVGYVQGITLESGTEVVIVDNVAIERKAGKNDSSARNFLRRWQASKH